MNIQIKRVYDPPSADDGKRFLVDRLWPRGIKKENLLIDAWVKDASPSNELRKWMQHDPEKWEEFRKRYFAELNHSSAAWEPLLEAAQHGTITLVYAARDVEHNNAVALKEFLERNLAKA